MFQFFLFIATNVEVSFLTVKSGAALVYFSKGSVLGQKSCVFKQSACLGCPRTADRERTSGIKGESAALRQFLGYDFNGSLL